MMCGENTNEKQIIAFRMEGSRVQHRNNNNPMGNYAIVKIRTYPRRTHMCASQSVACTDVVHHGVAQKPKK